MSWSPPRWSAAVLSVLYVVTGLLHLLAGLIIFLAFGKATDFPSEPGLLPVYGRLGTLGYVLFFLTIPLDFIAGAFLLRSRNRGRAWIMTAAFFNLPLIPLGTLVSVGSFALFGLLRHSESGPRD
jgi:hypothetical protein